MSDDIKAPELSSLLKTMSLTQLQWQLHKATIEGTKRYVKLMEVQKQIMSYQLALKVRFPEAYDVYAKQFKAIVGDETRPGETANEPPVEPGPAGNSESDDVR